MRLVLLFAAWSTGNGALLSKTSAISSVKRVLASEGQFPE
jgi:hypothetical protein